MALATLKNLGTYMVGQPVELSGAFTDPATGVLTNPTGVFVRVKGPDQTVTVYEFGVDSEITRPSTGNYKFSGANATEGRWHGKMYSTGTGQTAAQGYWDVEADMSANSPAIEYADVPAGRVLKVSDRSDGSPYVDKQIRMRKNETLNWALEFSGTQLVSHANLNGVSEPLPSGDQSASLTVSSYGKWKKGDRLNMKLVTAVGAATTDDISLAVQVAPDTGEVFTLSIPVEIIA